MPHRLQLVTEPKQRATILNASFRCLLERALNQEFKTIITKALRLSAVGLIAVGIWLASGTLVLAQQIGLPVQLPTVNQFSINTVVSVPDGGTLSLGGVSSQSASSSSNGIPGLGPLGRPFSNRSSSVTNSASRASIKVQILSSREMSEDVLAAARAARPANYEEIQARDRRADFLTRNMGRNSGANRRR